MIYTMRQVTRKEACEIIRKGVAEGTTKSEDLKKVLFAVNNDVQVRDFLLGLRQYYKVDDVANLIKEVLNEAELSQAVPLLTVMAAYAYEDSEKEIANAFLSMAKLIDPDYSMITLLQRVFNAEWPSESFTTLRENLSTKVMENCYGVDGDKVIEEIKKEV